MAREPNRVKHTYDLTDGELRAAIRAYLNIDESAVMAVEWDSYGDSCEAEVTVTTSEHR